MSVDVVEADAPVDCTVDGNAVIDTGDTLWLANDTDARRRFEFEWRSPATFFVRLDDYLVKQDRSKAGPPTACLGIGKSCTTETILKGTCVAIGTTVGGPTVGDCVPER